MSTTITVVTETQAGAATTIQFSDRAGDVRYVADGNGWRDEQNGPTVRADGADVVAASVGYEAGRFTMSVQGVARPDEYIFYLEPADGSASRVLASYGRDDVGPQVFENGLRDIGCGDVQYERSERAVFLSVHESCIFDHRKQFTFNARLHTAAAGGANTDSLANNPGEKPPIVNWSGQPTTGTSSYNPDSPAGTIYRLYRAYFLREPDRAGYDYWLRTYNSGYPLRGISDDFVRSAEFQQRYGDLSNRQFVDRVYANVLNRAPDQDGYDYWLWQMEANGVPRGDVMIYFSDSAEFRHNTANGRPPGY